MPTFWTPTATSGVQHDTSFLVTMTTDEAVHVTIWVTTTRPRRHPRASPDSGTLDMEATYYCFVEAFPIEQNEPGDTLTHTFTIPDHLQKDGLWARAAATKAGQPTKSVGPITRLPAVPNYQPLATWGALPYSAIAPGDRIDKPFWSGTFLTPNVAIRVNSLQAWIYAPDPVLVWVELLLLQGSGPLHTWPIVAHGSAIVMAQTPVRSTFVWNRALNLAANKTYFVCLGASGTASFPAFWLSRNLYPPPFTNIRYSDNNRLTWKVPTFHTVNKAGSIGTSTAFTAWASRW